MLPFLSFIKRTNLMINKSQIKDFTSRTGVTPVFPPVIDSTMLNAFRQCETLWFYEHCLHKRSGRSIHLVFGGAIAAALESYRLIRCNDGTHEDALTAGVITAIEEYGDFESYDPKDAKTWLRCIELLIYFTEEAYIWEADEYEVYKKMVEFTFAIPMHESLVHPLSGEPIMFGGRCDWIARNKSTGTIWVADEKTTKTTLHSNYYTAGWPMRGQFLGYAWAAGQHGIKVEGAMVRGLQVIKTKFDHHDTEILIPKYKQDRWFEDALLTVNDMIESFKEQTFKQNWGESFNSFGGCGFMDTCSAKDIVPWLDEMDTHHWNPVAKVPIRTE